MIDKLAETLAGVDDPKTAERILEYSLGHLEKPSPQHCSTDQATLDEFYHRYLSRRENRSTATRSQYQRTIPKFIKFAEDNGVTTPAELSSELVDRYVDDLKEEYSTDATILTYTKNLRSWLRWLHTRDHCSEMVCRILNQDELGLTPRARDEAPESSEAIAILEALRQRRRGTLMHALLEVIWNTGLRIGGVHSLDVDDFDPNYNELRVRHRPESGTRLKNGSHAEDTAGDGERNVALSQPVVEALDDYITITRPDISDDHGREPLFATIHGRATRSTLRRQVYRATSCRWASKSSDGETCDGSCDPDSDVCSYSYYPHAIRRGAIVNHLSGGLHPSIASERFDVSNHTLRKHYDPRTMRKRKEDRSEAVRSAWSE